MCTIIICYNVMVYSYTSLAIASVYVCMQRGKKEIKSVWGGGGVKDSR